MTTRGSVAASVREDKQNRPWAYCSVKPCLWRVVHRDGRVTPCRNHPNAPLPPEPPKVPA